MFFLMYITQYSVRYVWGRGFCKGSENEIYYGWRLWTDKESLHPYWTSCYHCTTELFFKIKKRHFLTPIRAHFTLDTVKLFTSSHAEGVLHSISVHADWTAGRHCYYCNTGRRSIFGRLLNVWRSIRNGRSIRSKKLSGQGTKLWKIEYLKCSEKKHADEDNRGGKTQR